MSSALGDNPLAHSKPAEAVDPKGPVTGPGWKGEGDDRDTQLSQDPTVTYQAGEDVTA